MKEKRQRFFFFLFGCGMAAGTFIGSWIKQWFSEEIVMISSLFLQQFSQVNLTNKRYFIYVLRIRGMEIAVIYAMLITGRYQIFWKWMCFIGGFCCGIAIFGITFWKGPAGIFLFLLWIFPHMYLYGLGGILLWAVSRRKKYVSFAQQRNDAMKVGAIFAAGIMGEIFVQPYFIHWFVKTFT